MKLPLTASYYHSINSSYVYYSNEIIKRGIAGVGNYSLAEKYEQLKTVHLENEIIKHPPPDEIVKRLKYKMSESSKTFKADFKQEVDDKESIPTSHLSMYARTMLIVENDNIVFNTKMSAFIVKGSKEVKRIVTLFPKEACSCLPTGEYYHILAAKINLGMATEKEKVACNLTAVRKNGRPKVESSVVLVRPCNFSFSFSYSKLDKTF